MSDEAETMSHGGSRGISRRGFIGAAAGIAAGAALIDGSGIVRPARAHRPEGGGRARNLIFCVSDGMSAGTLTLADRMIRRRTGKPSCWLDLQSMSGVKRAMLDTSAADSIVTDSAAAATTWGIGRAVNNGSVGQMPDGRLMSPILLRAKEAGKATGLVTTTRLSHATPAGFIACIPTSRDDEGAIAEQILERGVDVMLGGGARYLTDQLIGARSDLHTVRTRAELLGVDPAALPESKRLLGVFSEQHMAFEVERPESEPSLTEMTRAALARLSRLPGGFVVQIEGGRVDHAAHSNDAGSLVRDQIAFDEALRIAAEFASSRDDTLLIVTTDHGNANPGLTEYGERGNAGFEKLAGCRHSFDWIVSRIQRTGPGLSNDALRGIVHEASGVVIDEEELSILQRSLRGERVDPYGSRGRGTGPLGSVLANHFGVAFLSPNHTCDYVELLAAGPGSERLPTFLTHAEVHALVIRALDLPDAREM